MKKVILLCLWLGVYTGIVNAITSFPPSATTNAATNININDATLNGKVQANTPSVSAIYFDYGISTSYGASILATPSTLPGDNTSNITAILSGLKSNTTYNYRVRAINISGEVGYGSNMTFKTPAAPTTLSVTSTAGGLSAAIVAAGGELSSVTNLTVTGTIDATDFKAMRDNMPQLAVLDISEVNIAYYKGAGGPNIDMDMTYEANQIPGWAFSSWFFNKEIQLKTIILPKTVTRINTAAFEYCSKLTSISIYVANPYFSTIDTDAFRQVSLSTLHIHIPVGSAISYANAYPWLSSSNIIDDLIIPPTITSFTPGNGCNGTSVTINGTGFTNVTAVSFGATPASSFVVNSTFQITAVYGNGSTGKIAITTLNGTTTSSTSFSEGSSIAYAYIANNSDNTVSVINTVTNTVTSTVSVGSSPYGVCASPDGSKVYVSNSMNNTVSVINTATNDVIATVNVGDGPQGIAVSPDGSWVYVANSWDNTVSVINTATNTIATTVRVRFERPQTVSVSPDGSKVYVTNYRDYIASVINTATNTESTIATLRYEPWDESVIPDVSKVYVANRGSRLNVVNTATNDVISIVNVGEDPQGIGVSLDGSRVYVANRSDNTVSVINAATNTVTATVAVGRSPQGVSVSPDGSKVYVANSSDNTVSVINTANNTVTATLAVGTNPISLGNFIAHIVSPCPQIPTITNISPKTGTTTGGTLVTITGTNLTGATVKFGSINATDVAVISATEITATAPAGTAGKVDITVTTAGGTSAKSSAGEFTYVVPATLTVTGNLRPFMHCAGSISEEQSFTVSGSDLSSDITINSLMGFEYSTTSGSDFKPSLTLPKNGTSVATTRVYVRATTAATGNSSDNISITSNNATNQTIAIARYTSGGRFYATGNTFTVSLGCSSNVNVYSVSGTKYVFKLASGSWIGSASGATIDGTTLTIDATGLSAYDTFEIINDASGASVVIGSYAAASTYNDNFIINLDKRAGIIEFKGANNFTGSNRLSVTTDSYIRTLYSTDSRLTTVNGDLTLSANMQTPANGFSFYGIILFSPVECTGTGTLTIKAKGSSYPGILCQSRIIGGTSGLLTIEGYGGESSGNNMHGVIIDGSSSFISSNGCNVSVKGTGGGSPYKSYGVFVTNGGKITSSGTSASVTVEGAGGGTLRGNDNHGVCVDYDGIITSGGSSATVTVIGRGGNTTGNSNIGVKLDYGVTITSGGGNVTVNGTGGGSGVSSLNRGVFTFGNITAGGIGEVNVIGRGGNTTGTGTVNEGILIYDCKISSNKGNVSVKGLPGGNTDTGVNVGEGGSISSGGTATSVLIEGSDENKPSSISLYSNSSSHPSSITSGGGDISIISNRISTWGTCSVTTATNGGNISLTANSLSIQSGISCGSTGILSIMQKTDGIGFDLGNGLNDAWTGPICLSPTELGYLSAGTIKLGNNKTGNIVISQANTLSSDIFLTSASTNGVKPTGYGTDLTISGKTLRFNSGTPLKISINSKPVNALTDALKVSGTVNLSGVNLTLEGNYTPLPGDVFPIISATSITNTFSGLANGETILFKGKLLKVNYTENEVTLTCFAPTATTSAAADITPLGATLNGTVNANNASTTVTFEYGLTTSYGSSVTAAQSPISGTSATAVSAALTGLEYNTTYYYRVKAENAGGITYGDRLSFKTLEKYIFTISSPTATAIKLTTAKLGATIAPANAPVLERGICWSTTKGVTIDDNKTSAGGNTAGTFTVDVSDFTENSTIYYRGYVITHYNETILSDEANFSNVPVFTGDGDWDEVTKWNVQELPNSHVNHPIINGKCTISNYSTNGLKCGDLTINEGAKLTVNPAQKFIVMGKVTNNAGVDGLVFKANASLPTASFGYVFGAPSATVEMYSKASWDLTETTGSQFNWQYFGIPVKTVPYSSVFQNCIVRRHNETAIVDANLWKMETADSTLTSGSGYEITQAAPTTYTFKGELTNAEFTRTLPYTMGAKYPGQHIFSNPFLCAIKIKKINFGANTNESIYLYNTGTQNNWKEQASFDGNAPGQYTVSTKLTAGIDGIPAQIPSMQGFLIKTTGTATGSFSVDFWDETMEDNKDLQRAPRTNATDEKVITRIDVTSKQSADRMWIFTEPTCTRNFDNGWDGYKMMGSVVNPQLFAMEADGNYQINAVPTINETYLGFQAGQDTDYTLKFTQLNVASTYNKLYLMDLVDGHIVDITADGSEYSFKASSTPQAVKRFKIVADVDNSTGNTEIVNNNLKISHSNETIYIENRSDQRGTCTIYDLKGVAIKINLFDAQKVSLISTRGLIPGVYLIKAGNGIVQVTEKIIIR